MLIIIMHNRQDYLRVLLSFAETKGVENAKIIKLKDIDFSMLEKKIVSIFNKGGFIDEYDTAFVAEVKDEEKAKHLLKLIENDTTLNLFNLVDKGFICTVPFSQIKDIEFESSFVREGI